MRKSIEIILKPRLMVLNAVKDLTADQLNLVPQGFNNNIIWNLAHMISAQQGICYTRAGLPIVTDDKFYTPYRPDTKPVDFVGEEDIATIKELFVSTIEQLETDLDKEIFGNYGSFTTRYGAELDSIDTAVAFLPFHEGLHAGYIMSLKKFLPKG
jgi:hypothetical protein